MCSFKNVFCNGQVTYMKHNFLFIHCSFENCMLIPKTACNIKEMFVCVVHMSMYVLCQYKV